MQTEWGKKIKQNDFNKELGKYKEHNTETKVEAIRNRLDTEHISNLEGRAMEIIQWEIAGGKTKI